MTVREMKYKQIVFDIDGTLIDTEYAVLHSLQETLKTLCGEDIPIEELNYALGITGADALKKFHIEDIPSALDLWNKNMRKYNDTIKVFNGIPELLASLSESGYGIGIVTSKTREEYEKDFVPFEVYQYFSTVICANDTSEHKPMPAPLFKYMKLAEEDHNKILYVGDSIYDGMCARSAGVDFALAVWGSHTQSIQADYYLKKPLDLMMIINEVDYKKHLRISQQPG